jgi:hypothetical protein
MKEIRNSYGGKTSNVSIANFVLGFLAGYVPKYVYRKSHSLA